MQIMIVDDNMPEIEYLVIGLRHKGYEVLKAESGDAALGHMEKKSNKIDLVLTDYMMSKMTGLDLLKAIRDKYPFMPVIIMTAFVKEDVVIEALKNRCDGFIEKPFGIERLIEEIKRVKIFYDSIFDGLKTSPKGYIHGFTMATFLQAVQTDRMDCAIKIKAKEKIGHMFFKRGELIDAETDGLSGEKAALEMVGWDDTWMKLEDHRERGRSIESSLSYILLEGYRLKDERAKEKAAPFDDEKILKKGVWLAEGYRFREAEETLKKYLKANPRGARGWMWYSRVIKDMNDIEIALNNASEASPGDSEIIEDLMKLRLAKENGEEGKFRHCPFCWYLIKDKALKCSFCKAHLTIHRKAFGEMSVASKAVMDRATKRNERILEKERNISAHYYLSVAHFNVGQMKEALSQIHKAVNLAPKNKFLSDQLNSLINHLKPNEAVRIDKAAERGAASVVENGKTILVVEDSQTVRGLVTVTLTQNGYRVIEAKDGLEALSKLAEAEPDLVLLDIILPKMDGYEVLTIVKSNDDYNDIPIVMLTGKDSFYDKTKGELSGAAAYLTKPFNQEDLLETIEKYT